jgi:hypothetical protein
MIGGFFFTTFFSSFLPDLGVSRILGVGIASFYFFDKEMFRRSVFCSNYNYGTFLGVFVTV